MTKRQAIVKGWILTIGGLFYPIKSKVDEDGWCKKEDLEVYGKPIETPEIPSTRKYFKNGEYQYEIDYNILEVECTIYVRPKIIKNIQD